MAGSRKRSVLPMRPSDSSVVYLCVVVFRYGEAGEMTARARKRRSWAPIDTATVANGTARRSPTGNVKLFSFTALSQSRRSPAPAGRGEKAGARISQT